MQFNVFDEIIRGFVALPLVRYLRQRVDAIFDAID
jgi:hypothetical protein